MTHEIENPAAATTNRFIAEGLIAFEESDAALQRIFNAWQHHGRLEGSYKSEWQELKERALSSLNDEDDF